MGLAIGGCSIFGSSDPEVVYERTFRGPPIGLSSTERVHVVTAQAPNPGWRLVFDRSEEAPGPTQLLVSMRRPDPTLIYTHQVADLSAASDVPTDERVEVFARIIGHDERRAKTPYERVLLGIGPE